MSQQGKRGTEYEFVPYQFGCFSFQAQQDLNTLIKYQDVKLVPESSKWVLNKSGYLHTLSENDIAVLQKIKNEFDGFSVSDLINFTYRSFPYYALNSKVAAKYLNWQELQIVNNSVAKQKSKALLTIGYEGKSLEAYLNKLIMSGVKLLVDVRRNAISMKYGFSKKQLENGCQGVKIQYLHIPELGIESDKRQTLVSQADYDCLFEDYKKSLPQRSVAIGYLFDLIDEFDRVAISCFEACEAQCHRGTLAKYLKLDPNAEFQLIHL